MVRSIGQEMAATKKIACSSQFPRGRDTHAVHRRNIEKYLGWSEGKESLWKMWARDFIVASMGRKGKAG